MDFYTLTGSKKKLRYAGKYRINWQNDSVSIFQTKFKNIIFPYWRNDIVFEEFPVIGSRLTLDFYNATLRTAVEIQGQQHTKYVKFFHGKSKLNYIKQLKNDQDKFNFCEKNDIRLVEIFKEEEMEDFIKNEYGKRNN
jgi:hypothetical protein